MPTWEVLITSTTTQSMQVEADTEAEAVAKARQASEEDRGPATVDWDFDASMVEYVEEDDDN